MRPTSYNKDLIDVIKLIAPGTPFREGLENVLRAKTGALIVVGDSEEIRHLCHGGFIINAPYSPYSVYELSKMDGAVILSKDADRILFANVELNPNSLIPTLETGIRHRTAERVARQTDQIVVSISQRRNIISVYYGELKYIVQQTNHLLTKANQAIQTLDKYRVSLNRELVNLSVLELEDSVNVSDVLKTIKRAEMVLRVADEVERFILELGNEGRLLEMQLDELVINVEKDLRSMIKDYMLDYSDQKVLEAIKQMALLSDDSLIVDASVAPIIGFSSEAVALDIQVSSRGYRILSKIPRMPLTVTRKLLDHFDDFQGIINASTDKLEEVEGIGEVRARNIVSGIRRFIEQVYQNNPINSSN